MLIYFAGRYLAFSWARDNFSKFAACLLMLFPKRSDTISFEIGLNRFNRRCDFSNQSNSARYLGHVWCVLGALSLAFVENIVRLNLAPFDYSVLYNQAAINLRIIALTWSILCLDAIRAINILLRSGVASIGVHTLAQDSLIISRRLRLPRSRWLP